MKILPCPKLRLRAVKIRFSHSPSFSVKVHLKARVRVNCDNSVIMLVILFSLKTMELLENGLQPQHWSDSIVTARKRSFGQGNIFTSVCQEFCLRGGLLHCMLGYPPPLARQTPPPCAVHAGRYGQQVGSMHSTGMQSCFQ